MLIIDQLRKGDSPLRLVAVVVLACLGILSLRLWQVQVFNRKTYQQSVETQSFRTVRVPALRGRIFDRNGTVLAENQPRYRLDLYLDELRSDFADEFRQRKSALTAERLKDLPKQTILQKLTRFFRRRAAKPLIDAQEIALIERQARYAVASNVVADISTQIRQPLVIDEQRFFLHHRDKRALPLPIVNAATPSQVALATFLKNREAYLGLSSFMQAKRDAFIGLMKNTRFDMHVSHGSYFICAKYNRISDEADKDFAIRLTKEAGVATIPVSAFYQDSKDDKVLRFCFSKNEDTLERAVEKLVRL